MKLKDFVIYCIWPFVFPGVLSCSGGGEIADSGGIGGTGVTSSGTITAIGSVWVNGVRFDTRDAEVYLGDALQGVGDQTILDHLDPGKVVRVSGRLNSGGGSAVAVYYNPLIAGPISAIQVIDDYTSLLSILGQSVIIDDRTTLKGLSVDALALESLVEVSGFIKDDGQIQATFLNKQSDTPPSDAVFRITGPVSDPNPINRRFFINSQLIDYRQVDNGNRPPFSIEDGLFVSASGRLEENGSVFKAATLIEYRRLGDIETVKIGIEGIVGATQQQNQFSLEEYRVEFSPTTEYVGGDSDDLLNGVRVEVEGDYLSGIIFAEKIKFNQIFRAESDLAAKEPTDGSFTLAGLSGLDIATNALTRYSGLAANFGQINPGDHLVIKGWPIDGHTVLASQIIGRPAVQDKLLLRGTITRINGSAISINNVAIDMDSLPDAGFFISEETSVSRDLFLGMIQEDDWVAIKGRLNTDHSIVWDTITMVKTE